MTDEQSKQEWTQERRYKKYEDYSKDEINKIEQQVKQSVFRQSFHIQPKSGLLNDPNGFCFFNGEYHLFYQWFPMGPVHGIKYWYHLSSVDLVSWKDCGVAIAPDTVYDSHGVFSGSAIAVDNELMIMYTGNVRTKNWQRIPYQLIAKMNQENQLTKVEQPVIEDSPDGYTDHFRDPKIWKQGDMYYAVIGAQRVDETGACVLYSSKSGSEWKYTAEIQTKLATFGFMWECPDYFELDNKGILLFSPQGINAQGDLYNNKYQTGYLVGKPLDVNNGIFDHDKFVELDAGFDFYATQTTTTPDGRRLLIAWMGLPEITYPSDKDNWAHCLTIPREIEVDNHRLLQNQPKN